MQVKSRWCGCVQATEVGKNDGKGAQFKLVFALALVWFRAESEPNRAYLVGIQTNEPDLVSEKLSTVNWLVLEIPVAPFFSEPKPSTV